MPSFWIWDNESNYHIPIKCTYVDSKVTDTHFLMSHLIPVVLTWMKAQTFRTFFETELFPIIVKMTAVSLECTWSPASKSFVTFRFGLEIVGGKWNFPQHLYLKLVSIAHRSSKKWVTFCENALFCYTSLGYFCYSCKTNWQIYNLMKYSWTRI